MKSFFTKFLGTVLAIAAITMVPVVLLGWYYLVLSGTFARIRARNELVVAWLMAKYDTFGFRVVVAGRRELHSRFGMEKSALGQCDYEGNTICVAHAFRLDTVVDTFFHEVRHAEQFVDDTLRPKLVASSLAMRSGKVSYWDAWHEEDARRHAAIMTAAFPSNFH